MNGSCLIFAAAFLFGAGRVLLIGHENDLLMNCFKDAAHLFIGGLIASWWTLRTWRPIAAKYYGLLAIALSVLEVGCAIAGN